MDIEIQLLIAELWNSDGKKIIQVTHKKNPKPQSLWNICILFKTTCMFCFSASLLKGLKHANIVLLHDIIHTKETLTLVFEYVVSKELMLWIWSRVHWIWRKSSLYHQWSMHQAKITDYFRRLEALRDDALQWSGLKVVDWARPDSEMEKWQLGLSKDLTLFNWLFRVVPF